MHSPIIDPDRPAVRLDDVTVVRSGRTVLDGFSLAIPAGSVSAILGPSGSGKTTVLKLITGQLRPASGTVTIGRTDVHSLGRSALNDLRRHVGVLLQNGALLTDLTVFDNVALPLREHTDLPASLIRRVVLLKLQAVGLRGAAELFPGQLSGGMNRRVAMARALALDPDLMLYDEPFAGLDPISLAAGARLIKQINRVLGITSVVITHDVAVVEDFADHACIIADGRVVAHGSPRELHDSDDPLVRQFMDGLPDGPVPFHYPASDLADDLLGSAER
ncbi:ATP-binding cassette domain-containing protein [Wenzhouxiangella sp. XN79A]|uniref:ABC transporter ATP-binding protein n=1 Tax=Wenzhouxiangella sp. XN79A TaxID=2724193 RepID=UPI00144AB407|nr:ATP-binding cassette domain-containing protein [Wenzhouxiangella sp. XN79A]NKI35809.1 ATP-binding cassette domain-containing protein [Wenzhouxiangella sp. XN79A]